MYQERYMKKSNWILIALFIALESIVSGKTVEPITFKADRVEYIYKKGKEKVTCKGNSKIERSDFFMKAETIYIFGEKRDFSKAYKDIHMINKIDNVEIFGDYAEYDNIKGYAKVFQSPRLIYTNDKLEITSAIMESYLNESKSIAIGNVKIIQTNYVAYCEKAVYWQKKEIIELTGDPIVYYEKNVFQGNKIIVYINKKMVKLYDNVKAKIISKDGK